MFFSIVIPIYNRAATIERCINSVICQSFSDWELLLIDDGSSDTTTYLVAKFIENDDRIKLLHRPKNRKKGANACRNIGIDNAAGKYVALLDADDEWKPKRLQNAHVFLSDKDCDAVYSGGVIFNGEIEFERFSRQILPQESALDFLLSDDTFAPTPSLIVKRELARSIRFDESLLRNQDYDFFIRIHLHSSWIFYDNFDILVHWLKGENRNYHFSSNIAFIEKHKHLTKDFNLLFRFFYNNWLIAYKLHSAESTYFLKEMKNLFPNVNGKNKLRYILRRVMFLYYVQRKLV